MLGSTAMGREASKWAHPHSSLEPGQFTSLALTHVQFHPEDPLSMPLALVTLAPPFLMTAYVTVLLVRRELTVLLGFAGQLMCEGVNLALKRFFKQGRPTNFLGTGYGMPSSHSQFAGFFAAYWTCHLLRFQPGMTKRARARRRRQDYKWSLIAMLRLAEHRALLGLILLGCTIVPYSRYHLAYHSAPQILVGLAAGVVCALVYYQIVEVWARKPFTRHQRSPRDLLLDSPVFVALRIRDSWSIYDDGGIEADYAHYAQRRNMMRWQREEESAPTTGLTGTSNDDIDHMQNALRLASQCDATTTAFCVGCVIAEKGSREALSTGYSREEPGNTHAEEVALNRLISRSLSAKDVQTSPEQVIELNLYTTMEPCSERLSKKDPCVERVLAFNEGRHTLNKGQGLRDARPMRITRILQGVTEPDDFVADADGTRQLRERGQGISVETLQPGERFVRIDPESRAYETIKLKPGWLAREAARLAKHGHEDQPSLDDVNEERVWREREWMPMRKRRGDKNASSFSEGVQRWGNEVDYDSKSQ